MKYDEELKKLFELRKKSNDGMVALKRSLQIEDMCPSAFEHGTCKAGWRTDENRNPVFGIVRGDGSTITFSFDEVPDFFKLEEAAKLGITAAPSVFNRHNDPVSKEIQKFLWLRARSRRLAKMGN